MQLRSRQPILARAVSDQHLRASETLQRRQLPPKWITKNRSGSAKVFAMPATPASDAVSKATDQMKDRFDEGTAYARDNFGKLGETLPGKETFTRAQSSLSDLLERQPLVLGAVGLAIGAAVAGAFRTFDLENEWVGEYSDSVKDDLNKRAGALSQSVREAADTLKNEITDVGAETFDRVKRAGVGAAEAAGQKMKTP